MCCAACVVNVVNADKIKTLKVFGLVDFYFCTITNTQAYKLRIQFGEGANLEQGDYSMDATFHAAVFKKCVFEIQ